MASESSVYGWAVVFASFVTYFWTWGSFYALSVLFEVWREEFGGSYHSTAWVLSLYPAMQQLLSVWAAGVAEAKGARAAGLVGAVLFAAGYLFSSLATHLWQLYVTYGVMVGAGSSFLTISSAAIAGQYFVPSRRRFAMGIATAGVGVGTAVLAPCLSLVHSTHGWRWGFRAVASLSAVSLVASALLLVPRSALTKPVDGPPAAARMPFSLKFFKDPVYRCLLLAAPLLYVSVWVLPIFMASYATSLGMSSTHIAGLVASFGALAALSRLAMGLCGGRWSVVRVCVMAIAFRAAATFAFGFARATWLFGAVVVVTAVLGANALQLPRLVAENFPLTYLQGLLNSLYMFAGVASAVGGPTVGLLIDSATQLSSGLSGMPYMVAAPTAFELGGVLFGCCLAFAALPIACVPSAAKSQRRVTGLLDIDTVSCKAMSLADAAVNLSTVTLDSASAGSGDSDAEDENAPFLVDRV